MVISSDIPKINLSHIGFMIARTVLLIVCFLRWIGFSVDYICFIESCAMKHKYE